MILCMPGDLFQHLKQAKVSSPCFISVFTFHKTPQPTLSGLFNYVVKPNQTKQLMKQRYGFCSDLLSTL